MVSDSFHGARITKLTGQLAASRISEDDYFAQLRLMSDPHWVPQRPQPQLPSLWRIAKYWATRDVFRVDLEQPHCFGCGMYARSQNTSSPRFRWQMARLEKGHLVNRARYGLDGVQNLVPLCYRCNHGMPIFDSPGPPSPIDWVLNGGWAQYYEFGPDGVPRYVPERFQHSVVTVPVWEA